MPLAILALLERCAQCGAPPGRPCSETLHNLSSLRDAIKKFHPSHTFVVFTATKGT